MLGAKLGAATGIPGMGAVGGMVGSMAGGAVGKAIGGLIEPIVEPFKEWFGMVSKVFNDVLKDIKEPLEQFFSALGAFMSKILKVVEPHLPMITKIISTGIQIVFAPLFLGIKALTAVLKLFTGGEGKGEEKTVEVPEDAVETPSGGNETKTLLIAGMPVGEKLTKEQLAIIGMARQMDESNFKRYPPNVQQMYEEQSAGQQPTEEKSRGGWIKGPQSGYKVSLDGRKPSFIGHGTEWVGRKAGGKAFVVPFDTPATRTDRGLTNRRLGEAARGGYSLPRGFAGGGELKGWKRWLAGAADQVTGGFWDFDKKGHSIYQASGQLQKAGEIIENVKQQMTSNKAEKLSQPSVTQINDSNPAVVVGEEGDDMPILIPGEKELDADKYIKPKYGLIAEFLTDPVEFM